MVRHRNRRVVFLTGLLVAGGLGFMTSADARPAPGSSAPPETAIVVPDMGPDFSSRPAPTDSRSRLTAADAVAAAYGFQMPPDMTPGEPDVILQLVTYWPTGMTSIGNGQATDGYGVADVYVARLAWIVLFHDSPLVLYGPPGQNQEQRAEMMATAECVLRVIVDANTGEGLDVTQLCTSG